MHACSRDGSGVIVRERGASRPIRRPVDEGSEHWLRDVGMHAIEEDETARRRGRTLTVDSMRKKGRPTVVCQFWGCCAEESGVAVLVVLL